MLGARLVDLQNGVSAKGVSKNAILVDALFTSDLSNELRHAAYLPVFVDISVAALELFVAHDPDLMVMVEQLSDDIVQRLTILGNFVAMISIQLPPGA